MENFNRSVSEISEFILIGYMGFEAYRYQLFAIFLCMYLITLVGNTAILTAVKINRQLHTPMYYLLCNLAFLDIMYTTVTVPKMLEKFLVGAKCTISFHGCLCQMYFFLSLSAIECLLLTVMAYDRYIAICNPLRYTSIISTKVCILLAALAWSVGFVCTLPCTVLLLRLSFCGPKEIYHYYCDHPQILKVACNDTSLNYYVSLYVAAVVIVVPFLFILSTYLGILRVVLKIRSAEGRRKTFSTCSSHLVCVVIFYLSAGFAYFRPQETSASDYSIMASLLYSTLSPMLNPLIYSLRNKDIKMTLKRIIKCGNIAPEITAAAHTKSKQMGLSISQCG
ncbi:olfactory receptor 6N2-like [Latimeria chalumnae]|uniref:olfactory receptor 6N2-like n=1 Tax=Latimeria chalumnae TaxID=7897 RepID=UPI00313AF198